MRDDGKSKTKEDKEVIEDVGKMKKESGREKKMKLLSRGNV